VVTTGHPLTPNFRISSIVASGGDDPKPFMDASFARSNGTFPHLLLTSISTIIIMTATCEVVLVGCGAPGRGMGWYHAEQLLKGKCPSAVLKYIVEPWFLGPGALCLLSLSLLSV
jgi:hypothetical protein